MIPRRRLPPALLQHVLPRVGLAGLVLVLAVVGIVGAVLGAHEAERFERRAVLARARVLPSGGTGDRVPVELEVAGTTVTALAPAAEADDDEPGEVVDVLVDPDDPTSVRLVSEPYDLATPLAFLTGLAIVAVAGATITLVNVARLLRLARSPAAAFAFAGRLHHQSRMVRGEQTWVLLDALDRAPDSPPIASVPLLPDQPLPEERPFPALVKGEVRDGGLAVVLAGDKVLWPSGRVRVESPS